MSIELNKPGDTITCHVTMWYYRRMGLLAAMFVGMGLYFFYDGRIGYPKENAVAEKKVWFETEVMGAYDKAKSEGEAETQAWLQLARQNGWIVNPQLEQPRWDDFGAPHNWPSEPKMHSPDEVEQQYYWGGAMLVGAAIAGTLVLLTHSKTLKGHADHMVMPNGRTVMFANVFRVDKRKWDNKGLATVWYREREDGPERKVIVDDLKFHGAGRVLDRLLASFSGELIEKVAEPQESAASKEAAEDSSSTKAV